MTHEAGPKHNPNNLPPDAHQETRAAFVNNLIKDHGNSGEAALAIRMGQMTVDVTPSLTARLYEQHVADPEKQEFLKNTPEGKQIAAHLKELGYFKDDIGEKHLQYAQPGLEEDDERVQRFTSFTKTYGPFIASNYLKIDAPTLDIVNQYDQYPLEVTDYARKTEAKLRGYESQLKALPGQFLSNPHIRIGSTVNVLRSPRPGETEPWVDPDWTITGVLASGYLMTEGPDGIAKPQSINTLIRLNPENPAQSQEQ